MDRVPGLCAGPVQKHVDAGHMAVDKPGAPAATFRNHQDGPCRRAEALAAPGPFRQDLWQRDGRGGGRTHVLSDASVFEKTGIHFSELFGEMSTEFAAQVPGEGREFYAA